MPPKTPTTLTTLPPFTLSSPPGTDIWRKPPIHDVFTAPVHPAYLPIYPLEKFVRARLTLALPDAKELRQYDQGGLVLRLKRASGSEEGKDKWVKTGIEWYYNKPYVSTVACDVWADWSIVAIPSTTNTTTTTTNTNRPTATIEVVRESDALGKSLWVYQILPPSTPDGEEEKVPLREVTWFFAEEEGWEVGVGGYVARPTKEGGEGELEVEFGEGVVVEVYDC